MRGGGHGSGDFAFGDARRAPCDRGLLSGAYAPVGREGWRVGQEGGSWGADARIRVRPNERICRNGRTERKLGPSGLDAYGLRPQSPRMTMSVWSDGRCLLSAVRYSFLFMQACCLL